MKEIFVLAEHRQGALRDITFEMLALANQLGAEGRLEVTGIFLGHGQDTLVKDLTAACDHLQVFDDRELLTYNADPYLRTLEEIIKKRKPHLTMIGHTAEGMDLAPALAARLSLPLVTDCLDVALGDEGLTALRQIYGGKINARLVMKPFDQYIVTLRPGSFEGMKDHGKTADLDRGSSPDWTGMRGRRFLEYLEAEFADVDITGADILVSVGRGIGKPENIPLAREFAEAIGATLSCSRPVADEGWLPKSRQVGTSGKTVRPKVYIALGISGAYQHQAGMKNAETIIAVNTDARAPIFTIADYGILGDIMQVLPILQEKFAKK